MSSVGSSGSGPSNDRVSVTDEIRRNRDTYQKSEAETAKRTAQQIKRLNEAHEAELDQLKTDRVRDTEDMKTRTKETLSRRDMQYQKDMDDLRDLHKNQVARMATDAEERQKSVEGALKSDVNRITKTTDTQKKMIIENNEVASRAKDADFENYTEHARKEQQDATIHRTNLMNKDAEEKIGNVVRDRDERLEEKQGFVDRLRENKDEEITRLKRDRVSERNRLTAAANYNLEKERADDKQAQDNFRQEMAHDKKEIKAKFETAAEKLRRQDQVFRDDYADSAADRLQKRGHVFEEKARRLEEEAGRDKIKESHEKAREIADVRQNMQANVDQLENERSDLMEASNRRSRKEVEMVNKRDEKVLHEQNEYYQDKMALDAGRTEDRITKLTTEHERVMGHDRGANDARFEKLKSYGEVEQNRLRGYFERASDTMKENFETTLREMRDRNKREQDQLFAQFAKNAQENDAKFSQKLSDTNLHYQSQIADMQDNHLKDLKDIQQTAMREKAELTKKGDTDLRMQASTYEYRLSKLEETHKHEIEQLNRRHEETLANLTKNRQA